MTDRARCIATTSVVPLRFRCLGPRGEEGERQHLFHSGGSIDEDDRRNCEAGGWRALIGYAEEAEKSSASSVRLSSARPSVVSNVTSGRWTLLLVACCCGV